MSNLDIKFKRLSPFKRCVLQNFPFIEADFDALTNYGLLCKIVEYLNQVIASQNEVQGVTEELVTAFNNLYDYVNNYFDNLDVQEEINNKLDAMVESGELPEIIANYFDDKMKIIFPTYGKDGTDTMGDCTIIKNGDKSMMIDCFIDDNDCYAQITSTLLAQEISRLDYLLITHYDADHYGNIYKLINDGYLDNATVILPRDVTAHSYSGKNGDAIKAALTSAGINYIVCDNQTITLNDASIELFNGSATDHAHYDSLDDGDVQYNDYSIMCNIIYHDRKILLTADGDYAAMAWVTYRYLLSDYDFMKDNHHGYVKFNADFAKKVNPSYVVIPASKGMVSKNLSLWASLSSYWQQANNVKLYIQGYQSDPLVVYVGYDGLTVNDDAVSTQNFGGRGDLNYYVDGTTTNEVRTGSEEYPFKTLNEANALMGRGNDSARMFLRIVNTPADANETIFSGYKNLVIECNNKPINYRIRFFNCGNITVNDANITGMLYFENTNNAIVKNATIVSDTYSALEFYNTRVNLTGTLTTSGFSSQMIRVDNSEVKVNLTALTTTLNNHKIFAGSGDIFNFSNDAVTLFSSYKFHTQIMSNSNAKTCKWSDNTELLRRIYNSSTGATSDIVCTEEVWIYPYVYVQYVSADGYYNHIEKFPTSGSWNLKTSVVSQDGNTLYFASATASFNNKNITLSRNREFQFTTGGVTLGQENAIKIKAIWGSYE